VCCLGEVPPSGGVTGAASRLNRVREDGRETDRFFSETQYLEDPWTPSAIEKQAVSTSSI